MYDYSFTLPDHLLATEPVTPRDSAKLLVYDTHKDQVQISTFQHLARFIPANSLLVLNETVVAPTRIKLTKKVHGGGVICLFLLNELTGEDTVKLMVDRKVQIGDVLCLQDTDVITIQAHIEASVFSGQLCMTRAHLLELLGRHGAMPIPLYLRGTDMSAEDLRERYQTTFARLDSSSQEQLASVAAPTASLHFTDEVFTSLTQKHIDTARVRLEVGLGTFAPLRPENFTTNTLHTEWCSIPDESIEKISNFKAQRSPIVAVGTTVVRTLESWAGKGSHFHLQPTNIFIHPGFHFKVVDFLITNFHLPESSLMMLVQALLHEKKAKKTLKDLYEIAISHEFRFYSFGDSMLIV